MVVCHRCASFWCFRPFSVLCERASSNVSSWSSKPQPGQHKVCWHFFVILYHLVVDMIKHIHTPLRHMLYLQIKQDLFNGRYIQPSHLHYELIDVIHIAVGCSALTRSYSIVSLALPCSVSLAMKLPHSSYIEFLLTCLYIAEIGDFTAQRCGLTYVSDFELIPVLVSDVILITAWMWFDCFFGWQTHSLATEESIAHLHRLNRWACTCMCTQPSLDSLLHKLCCALNPLPPPSPPGAVLAKNVR